MHATTEIKFAPLLTSGILLGLGMGSLLDGIILHQVLQLHHAISAKVSPTTLEKLKMNIFWDGIFGFMTWTTMLFGIYFFWKAISNPYTPRSQKAFSGSLILGVGVYCALEGLINHFFLKVHHIIENASLKGILFWDLLFVMLGIAMILWGRFLIGLGKRRYYAKEVEVSRWKKFKFNPAFRRLRQH